MDLPSYPQGFGRACSFFLLPRFVPRQALLPPFSTLRTRPIRKAWIWNKETGALQGATADHLSGGA